MKLKDKMVTKFRRVLYLLVLLGLVSVMQAKPVEIYFWHSMAGAQGAALQTMVDQFNHSQSLYEIVSVYKGDYNTTLTALVAAYRARKQPTICQVLDVGTAMMMSAKTAVIPVDTLMRRYRYPLSSQAFLPAISAYYSSAHGKLMSLPFNASSPVLYYNKQAFIKAGLNPNKPPKTWPQVEQYGKRLLQAGYACAYTTTWPSWIQLEVFSAWHDIPYATQGNGFQGFNIKVLYNNALIEKQVATLARWQKIGLFEYGGRGDNAQTLFTSGRCAMYTQSSGAAGSVATQAPFPVGIGMLPYWPSVKKAPQNTIIGGASLWVMAGKSPIRYQGAAAFFHFLLKPKNQLFWQEKTGYLPLTKAAYKLGLAVGFYKKHPGYQVAIKELTHKLPTAYSRGIRLGNFLQIRDINDTALEQVFSGKLTVEQALARAVNNANQLLARFNEEVNS